MRIHVVGIGGAGMSAIAKLLLAAGHDVTGSDSGRWPLADALIPAGALVYDTFASEHVAGADVVLRSSAYPEDHIEVRAGRERGLKVWKREDAWRYLAEGKRVVAVAGTHGKTTTTGLSWAAIRAGGVNASLICGGTLRDLGTNAHAGTSDVLVIEADEYDHTFQALSPKVAVVTNVDHDHVDMFPTRRDYAEAFQTFASRVGTGGVLICCSDDSGGLALADWARSNTNARVLTYGLGEDAQYRVWQLPRTPDAYALAERTLLRSDRTEFAPRIPGWHNALNAAAAFLAAEAIGVRRSAARSGIESFSGIERRLESIGKVADIEVFDDYAHHPAEIRVGLATFSETPGNTIVVFQPHTPSRLHAFFDDFVQVLRASERLVVIETFSSAREAPETESYARKLADAAGGQYAATAEEAAMLAVRAAHPGDVVLVMGAGNVRPVGERILELLREPARA